MKQNEENSQKAQKLTKEELEQVNGGRGPHNPDPNPILKKVTKFIKEHGC